MSSTKHAASNQAGLNQLRGGDAAISKGRWRSAVFITLAACALYIGFRRLPTGTNLHHMDFQLSGKGSLEMCDPTRPQFIPVVAVRSPVRVALATESGLMPHRDEIGQFILTLATAGGKPISPVDLLMVHTRKLHLLVIDETLGDYQHLHPEPGVRPGEWRFAHKPSQTGTYRVFADFTPSATGRSLYAFADYTVLGGEAVKNQMADDLARLGTEAPINGWRFLLTTQDGTPVRAGDPTTLVFKGREVDGGAVPLALVMDAYAHLVGFDAARSGFAHLHPRMALTRNDQMPVPDAVAPKLAFDLMIPSAGRYVIWAQIYLSGQQRFIPFSLQVLP
jgi:hypothetical protein